MTKPVNDLVASDVRSQFYYRDGHLWWKESGTGRRLSQPAGSTGGKGYHQIMVNCRLYLAHRLIWLYHYGKWPIEQIDHMDGDKSNNRIENLREASNMQNCYNHGVRRHNTSGYKGVTWHKGSKKWRARITINKRRIHLGAFESPKEASVVYNNAARKFHGAFARTG